MGASSQYHAVPNKCRKKKFVKRIVKDTEPAPRESLSKSTYLTPDKSIRVNKGHDLFDQLLNSSSPRNIETETKKSNVIDKIYLRGDTKTYATRKTRKIKKYNYSSSDSESDKENDSRDLSDIRIHKLIVEKEVQKSPKCPDDSINNVIQNFSLLKNIKNVSNNSLSSPIIPSFKCRRKTVKKSNSPYLHKGFSITPLKEKCERRTKNSNSPQLQKSIISSTPFKDKVRTLTSIYKYSPISRNSRSSSNYVTITEENDGNDEIHNSPVLNTGKNKTKDLKENISICNQVNNSYNEVVFDKDVSFNDDNIIDESKVMNHDDSHMIFSLDGTQPSKPFLGFTLIDANDDENNKILVDLIEKEMKENASTHNVSNDSVHSNETDSNSKVDDSLCIEIKHSKEIEKELDSNSSVSIASQDSVVNNDQTSNDNKSEIYNTSVNSQTDVESLNSRSERSEVSNASVNSQVEVESLYDTCNEDSDDGNISHSHQKELVVNLVRMEDNKFFKYYDKMADYEIDKDISRHNASHDHSINTSKETELEAIKYDDIDSDDVIFEEGDRSFEENCNSENEGDESYEPDDDQLDLNSNDEERCFVNTRRRVETTNNSTVISLDNSDSSSNADCDKTVLSNVKLNNEFDREFDNFQQNKIDVLSFKHNESDRLSLDSNCSKENLEKDENRVSFVTTRKSRNSRKSSLPKSPDMVCEAKPTIVLQPGKKWERSLSIYRRMTMMNDHIDRSIIEDETLNYKGRKYRQSVMNCMEMQEASLHNESISSRRSTFCFAAKPCRSTITILRDPNSSRLSLNNTTVYDDLKGFLSDDCDDTVVELSKLSIAEDHDITVVEKLHDSGRLTTARDYVLRRCNQTDAILFDECYPDTALKNCHKIGEGVYGEVFLWRARDGHARVMKIVPIAGDVRVNGENQKDYHEIISEIVIAMELSALRAPIAEIERQFDEGRDTDALDFHSIQNATDVFNEVLAVRCVIGSYPSRLLDLWDLYDETKGSENDNPAVLPGDQQYVVLELANAGQDLESYHFNNAEQAYALFLQVAFGLAVGEEAFQFEHRDLHWGNVLISPTEQKYATFILRGRAHRVPRRGVAATVIDYSLSRLSLPLASPASPASPACPASPASAADCAALYNDLQADDGLFDAVGDYQFEVYRLMRDKLGNDWKNFEPYTNILWLHYTVDKMITALRYKRTNTKIHKHYISKLKSIKDRILNYGSAAQFVLTDIDY